jgi:hypothetical protein
MPVYRIGTTKVLFIHIPKTAGMAVGEHLAAAGTAVFDTRVKLRHGEFGPRHQPAEVLTRVFLPEMIDYAFMVVRHPLSRLVSEYRYQRRNAWPHLSRLRFLGFDIWLRLALWRAGRDPGSRLGHFRAQVDFECFGAEVFRYEDGLEAVMRRLSEVTGVHIPARTPPRNVSPPRQVSISHDSLRRVHDAYRADFDRFGYTDDLPPITGVTLA